VKKERIIWKFDSLREYEEFLKRIITLKNLGIPDTKEMRRGILHTMASQGILNRTYLKGQTEEQLELEIEEWAQNNLDRRSKDVSSGNESSNNGNIDGGHKGEPA